MEFPGGQQRKASERVPCREMPRKPAVQVGEGTARRMREGKMELRDYLISVENWIERGLQSPGLVREDTVSNKSKNMRKRGN